MQQRQQFFLAAISLAFLAISWNAVAIIGGSYALFYDWSDRGADFLKVILSLPGPTPASGPMSQLVDHYAQSPDYHGEVGLMHLPPLSMFLSLCIRQAFAIISPVVAYLGFIAVFLTATALIVRRYSENLIWVMVALFSYPVVFAIDRGNLYAGLAGLPLVIALLRKRLDWLAAVLLAVAINVRPNVAICALPLLFLDYRLAFKLGAVAAPLFVFSMVAAHALYPEYGLLAFLNGLKTYSEVYVPTYDGQAFNSSIYSAMFILGFGNQSLAMAIGLAPLGLAIPLYKRLSYSEFTFICLACSAMATVGFRDYHLLMFVAPLLLADSAFVLVPSMLLLVPKGYVLLPYLSAQLILNPAIMMLAVCAILAKGLARQASKTSLVPVKDRNSNGVVGSVRAFREEAAHDLVPVAGAKVG